VLAADVAQNSVARARQISLTPVDPITRLAGGRSSGFRDAVRPVDAGIVESVAEQREVVRSTLEVFSRGHDGPQGIALPTANWIVQAAA
jgi:hypothetical protein